MLAAMAKMPYQRKRFSAAYRRFKVALTLAVVLRLAAIGSGGIPEPPLFCGEPGCDDVVSFIIFYLKKSVRKSPLEMSPEKAPVKSVVLLAVFTHHTQRNHVEYQGGDKQHQSQCKRGQCFCAVKFLVTG